MDIKDYIGNKVKVVIDRKMGSGHPEYPNSIYPINYGYIPNTVSGDGMEIDVYLLGVFEAVDEYIGTCIAVIHRINDNENKLVVAPDGKDYTDEQIEALIEFQERFFESKIIRK